MLKTYNIGVFFYFNWFCIIWGENWYLEYGGKKYSNNNKLNNEILKKHHILKNTPAEKWISKKIKKGNEKFLIEIATGAGKTRVAISLSKRLFESNQISKVLFICDRNSLAIQAEKNFNKHIKDQTTYILNKKGFKTENII